MVIQHKIGDLFESNADFIAHQVNCQGVMGSGVAKQVRTLFPRTYARYRDVCTYKTKPLLGYMQLCAETLPNCKRVYIANLFAQDRYGYDGKRHTDYDAFRSCLRDLRMHAEIFRQLYGRKPQIAMPYRIGCDRGGGDWNTVLGIIEQELGDFDVTLCELPKESGQAS